MLGWRVLPHGEYRLDLPVLSKDEEELIFAAEEKFREAARLHDKKSDEESQRLIRTIIGKTAKENGVYLDRNQESYLSEMAFAHIYGFAFMEQIINDREVEEISVIGPNKPVYVFIRILI